MKKNIIYSARMIFSLCVGAFLFSSCSIKYGSETTADEDTPEFVFSNAVFSRYESNKITLQLKSTALEQYKKDSASYAENASFKTWNDKGELDTTGHCKILSMDSENQQYSLFQDITLRNFENNLYIIAEDLKYDGKTEQLTSGQNDSVYIQRDDLEMKGSGFSASGISQTFSFSGPVEGIIITEDEGE